MLRRFEISNCYVTEYLEKELLIYGHTGQPDHWSELGQRDHQQQRQKSEFHHRAPPLRAVVPDGIVRAGWLFALS